MFQSGIQVQVIAEQLNHKVYIYRDSKYFVDPDLMRDWLSGAVEWADRFRIFKVGKADFFFEAIVENHKVAKWEKIPMDKLERVSLYA